MAEDNPALRIYLLNRYAPTAGLVLAIVLILRLSPSDIDRSRLLVWAGIGVLLIAASLLDPLRPGFAKSLLPDGLPLTLHVHAALSGLWMGGVVWIDLDAASTNEFAYLAVLLVLGSLLGLMQFGSLGWHTPILMTSAVAATSLGLVLARHTMLAIGALVFLGISLRAVVSSARTYRELLVLRAEAANREAKATWFANHDPLTGAFNRRGIGDWLAAGDVEPSFCLFIDLDHFKMINDTLGHAIGDEVLLATAQILSDLVGPDGAVGRLGGDEFVALLDPAKHADQAAAATLGHNTLTALRTPLGADRPEVVASASIGVVPVGRGDTLRELLGRGDTALYDAKDRGRGRVVVGDEDRPPSEPASPGHNGRSDDAPEESSTSTSAPGDRRRLRG